MKNLRKMRSVAAVVAFMAMSVVASAQKYSGGVIDKTVAVIGNEVIMISDIEEEVQMQMSDFTSDKTSRCELLEQMMTSKLFLMQARVDSLVLDNSMVESNLSQRFDQLRTYYGGDEGVEEVFGKPIYKLRQEWRKALEDQTLTQQMQREIVTNVPELTPYDVQKYVDATDPADLPVHVRS